MADELRIPLRFHKADARILSRQADWCRSNGLDKASIALYEQAATAAREREPLNVVCKARSEVEEMASMFALLGIKRPAVG